MKALNVAGALVVATALVVGCGSGSAGGGGGGRPDAGPPQDKAWIRFGHLAPDVPAIDICVRPSGTADWGNPVLAANGITGGLSYPAMSRVVYVAPGSLDFRAVAAGGNCATPIGGDLTAQTIDAHGTYSIVAVGELAPGSAGPYRLQQYIEHAEAPAAGKARLRFTNVIPNSPPIADGVVTDGGVTDGGVLDGGVGGETWTYLSEAEMPFRVNASGTGIVDGYQDIDPNPALPLTIRASPPLQNPDIFTAPINLRAGIITGVWAIGLLGGTADQRVGYFVCDETPAASGGATTCNRE